MYYIIPVKEQNSECIIGIYENQKKVEEINTRIGEPADYFSWIDISGYQENLLELKLEKGDADLGSIVKANEKPERKGRHPFIHYTPDVGWLNDPNGLMYDDNAGEYHICFQHNPYGTMWGNMTWTHVKTKDFLKYSEEAKILRPSEDGPVFSGTALKVGDYYYYFYTIGTGNSFWSASRLKCNIQKVSKYDLKAGYVTDSHILNINTDSMEARDPRVFYKDGLYYLILYCKNNEFRIYASKDLQEWKEIQRIVETGMWECPDIFFLNDESGEEVCVFWSADGYYLIGKWTEAGFCKTGERKCAYQCNIDQYARYYAAQTFANTKKVLQIAWIQSEHRIGNCYTGELSIPVEIFLYTDNKEHYLGFRPAKELEKLRKSEACFELNMSEHLYRQFNSICSQKNQAYEIRIQNGDKRGKIEFNVGNTNLWINFSEQKLKCGKKEFNFSKQEKEIRFYADNDIIEIFSGTGQIYCVEETDNSCIRLKCNTCMKGKMYAYRLQNIRFE